MKDPSPDSRVPSRLAGLITGIDQDGITDTAFVFEQIQVPDDRFFLVFLHGHLIDNPKLSYSHKEYRMSIG
jgi:hypothetical protein